MPEYKLSRDFRDKIGTILGSHIFMVSKEDALMQASVAVLDAQGERDRMRVLLEAVRGELRTLAAVLIRSQHLERIVLTRKEFEEIPADLDLYVEAPEPGVRIYELRVRATPTAPASKLVLQ